MGRTSMAGEAADPAGRSEEAAMRYRFGPLERRGVVAGLSAGQVLSLAAGLSVSLALLRSVPVPANLPLSALAAAAGLVGGFLPVRGRTAAEWAPVLVLWCRRGPRPPHTWIAPHQSARPGEVLPAPPRVLSGCAVVAWEAAALGRPLGVVMDPRHGTCCAVMSVSGHGFPLLDPQEKERRLAAWSAVLAGLAREGSVLHRIQWVERTRPAWAGGLELASEERADDETPPGAARSYSELITAAGPLTPRHETLLTVAVSWARPGRAHRRSGLAAAAELLVRELVLLRGNLRSAEVEVDAVLGPSALRRALADGLGVAGPTWRSAWPMAVETRWSSIRVDGSWHATYWVAEWPRADVGPDFLVPLLLLGSAVRSVSVTMEPVSPARAAREVEAARTAGAADEELRRRGGFLPTARRRRAADGVARREVELADGHSEFRFSGYVTVAATTADALEASCTEVEQAAAQARLELRRLYGQQDEALCYTLPLARGLR